MDYFYRLARAKYKWQFFKANIFDLIAIMPFDKAFRIARLARLTRLARLSRSTRLVRALRLTKLARLALFLRRFSSSLSGVLKTNGLMYIVIATFGIVIFGACGIMAFEDNMTTFGDAIWWSMVTTTTVGYGDISPESAGGRVLAGILMVVGIGFLGMVTGSVATYFVDRLSKGQEEDKKKPSVLDEQIDYVKSKLDELETLSSTDIDIIQQIIAKTWQEKQKIE